MESLPSMGTLDLLLKEARSRIITQKVDHTGSTINGVKWDVLRTDLIHPVCSGNKLFKLYHYLAHAIQKNHTTVSTFGGAWSNHIVATAYAAGICGLKAIGYIRGEEPASWSSTLLDAKGYGMELVFLPRTEFDRLALQAWSPQEPALAEPYTIPMGGFGQMGAQGAAMMMDFASGGYTHIFCAAGTGTMLAGIASRAGSGTTVAGINVVKGSDLKKVLETLAPGVKVESYDQYQFGGYARPNGQLLDFMNQFFEQNRIPTDIVYTGKLMFAVQDLLNKNAFPKGSRILAIHSGGLQGNKSLKKGELIF